MRFRIPWRTAPRYIAIALALFGYAYLIDKMVTLTLNQQHELSTADDGQPEQPLVPDESR